MAHLMKLHGGAVGGILAHDSRFEGEHVVARKNENIDATRTKENFELQVRDDRLVKVRTTKESALASRKRVLQKIDQAKKFHKEVSGRAVKSNAVEAASWTITQPKDMDPSDSDKFFAACYTFVCDRYGDENILGFFVHMDETTPHAHIIFLPRDEDGRLNAKQVLDRQELRTFHKDLQKRMDDRGIKCSILLDDDDPKKALSGLEQKQYIKATKKIDSATAEIRSKAQELENRGRVLEAEKEALKTAQNAFTAEKNAWEEWKQEEERKLKRRRQVVEEQEEQAKSLMTEVKEAVRLGKLDVLARLDGIETFGTDTGGTVKQAQSEVDSITGFGH